jgi:hypothetical protein
MILIQQSDTAHSIDILMVQSADHVTPLTGATVTVTLSKNGGAFGAAAGTVAEIANGIYKLTPTSVDTGTLGELAIHATATSGDPADLLRQVVAFNPYDATALGLSRLDAAVTSRLATGNVTVGTNNDKTGYALASGEHTAIAADVLDVAASAHNSANTIGAKINSSGSAGDPWTTALPGSYSAGTAGAILGNPINVNLSEAVPTSNTAQTIGDALNAARAQGFGKWALVGNTLNLYAADGTTVVHAFTLDSGTSPTSRT